MIAINSGQKKIMVAMSGGVDSSVSAALLMGMGFTVIGVFMGLTREGGEAQADRARQIAERLGIAFEVVDLAAEFQAGVLDYFSKAYQGGKTPNPCVVCNRKIKFGLLRDYVRSRGITAMATGHYARTAQMADGRVRLLAGLDPKKDQSYFLCGLGQVHLTGVIFPLGETTKEAVYQAATGLGISNLHSPESQDICFLQGRDLATFFSDLPQLPGDFVTISGEGKGRHRGIHLYTIGQRRGLGISDATPYYVIGLDQARNQVIVGKEDDLWRRDLFLPEMHWTSGAEPPLPQNFMVKIRHRHQPAQALVSSKEGGGYTVIFITPQRAITPGQFAVLYQEDEVIGAGAIS